MLIDGDLVIDTKAILGSGNAPSDFIALPDGNFLLQYFDQSTQNGQSYYILDDNLDEVSGPHTGFTTTLGGNPEFDTTGCAGSA